MDIRTILIPILATMGLFFGEGASATTLYSTSGYADGSASSCSLSYNSCGVNYDYIYTTTDPSGNFGNVDTSGSDPSPSGYNIYETGTGSSPNASSSSWAKASIGVATAYASVSANAVAAGSDGTNARARADAQWSDSITVSSTTLAPGTPVDIYATLTDISTAFASGNSSTSNDVQEWADASLSAGGQYINVSDSHGDGFATCDNAPGTAYAEGSPCVDTLDVFTTVGSTFTLTGDLWLRASAVLNAGDPGPANVTLNGDLASSGSSGGVYQFGPANKAYVTLTSSVGARFTSASGYGYYVSAVPVPASVWLFASGLIGLIGISRRNKS